MDHKDFNDERFKQGSVRTYMKATRLVCESWQRVIGQSLKLHSTQPLSRFEEALAHITSALKDSQSKAAKIKDDITEASKSDPATHDLINDVLIVNAETRRTILERDMDSVPPRLCMDAIWNVARQNASNDEEVDVPLRDFLRAVMSEIAKNMGWPTALRVGENRHFPRMWQWLCEVTEASVVDGCHSIRVINTRGPVAAFPSGPGELRIRLKPGYF